MLTGSDQPNRTLGFGQNSPSTPEGDLSASSGIEIVIGEPHPHALQPGVSIFVWAINDRAGSPELTSR